MNIGDNVNGFVLLEYLGKGNKQMPMFKVSCKACKQPFNTCYYSLKRIKGCGCNRPSPLRLLPNEINGFKIIKDLGFNDIGRKNKERRVIAECKECKEKWETCPRYLKKQKHCGCRRNGEVACLYTKSHPQLAQAFSHMKGRCYNKNNQDYYNYGARGITICDEWLIDRNIFCEWSLDNGFENNKKLSIDRIDSSKGYSPENCRWVDDEAQARNTRRNVVTIELARTIRRDYEFMSQAQISRKYGLGASTISGIVLHKTWRE